MSRSAVYSKLNWNWWCNWYRQSRKSRKVGACIEFCEFDGWYAPHRVRLKNWWPACNHSRSISAWSPRTVRQSGFSIAWAKLVTTNVESLPVLPVTQNSTMSFYDLYNFLIFYIFKMSEYILLQTLLNIILLIFNFRLYRELTQPRLLGVGTARLRRQRLKHFVRRTATRCCPTLTATAKWSYSRRCRLLLICRNYPPDLAVEELACAPSATAGKPCPSPCRRLWL